VDGRAAIAALLGVAIGAVVAVRVGERRWWDASAICAMGTAIGLNLVTEGNHSRAEHNVVFAVGLVLLVYFVVAARAGRQARRRDHP
jgi:hypothetical protein